MKAPSFWWHNNLTFVSIIMLPFSWLYNLIIQLRYNLNAQSNVGIPVICIGNFTLGGAGKTPTAIAIAKLLIDKGHIPCFVTRGYGGAEAGPLKVDPKIHNADEVGDEPLMLAEIASAFMAKDRLQAAEMAREWGASIIIMDDGMQNPFIRKNLTISVIDENRALGNKQTFPAGPLRGSINWQKKLVDAILVIEGFGKHPTNPATFSNYSENTLSAKVEPNADLSQFKDQKLLAFAGIGHPGKFFNMLSQSGLNITQTLAFADHHRFNDDDAHHILQIAKDHGLKIVTTKKDMIRLRHATGPLEELRENSHAIDIDLQFANPDELVRLIERKIVPRC